MAASNVLVARQPIFNRGLEVEAYELLARATSVDDVFAELNESTATAKVIHDAFLQMDARRITDGLPMHLKFTRELLAEGSVLHLPADVTVVELRPGPRPDKELIDLCADLRRRGYRIALDHCVPGDPRIGVLPADLVKVPFSDTSPEDRARVVRRARAAGLRVLADELSTHADHEVARALEFDAFQGRFFQQPMPVSGLRMTGSRRGYLKLLQQTLAEPVDFGEVEDLIRRDVSLTWKFLNYSNAAFFGWRKRVESIRQGLVLLGERGTRRWVSLVALSAIGEDLPDELMATARLRARFCELIAASVADGPSPLDAFLAGMFSLLDAMLDEPLDALLAQACVPDVVADAILAGRGPIGAILELVGAYERAEWAQVGRQAAQIGIDGADLTQHYLDAVAWAQASKPQSTQP